MENNVEYTPKWNRRWRVILATLIFCALVIVYAMLVEEPKATHNTAIEFAFILAGTVVLGYTGLAVVDDKNVMLSRKR